MPHFDQQRFFNAFFLLPLLCSISVFSQDTSDRALFANPKIKTSYSDFMLEKNSHPDSLLPNLDGNETLAKFLQTNPNLWSIEKLHDEGTLSTKLDVNIIFIDGTKEEAFCNFSETSDAKNWELDIGVDFVSGSSNVAVVHVQQCINHARDSLGYAILNPEGRTIVIPPRKLQKTADTFPLELYMKLLKVHKSSIENECIDDTQTYSIILDVIKQAEDLEKSKTAERGPPFFGNRNIFRIAAFVLSATSFGLGLWQDSKVASKGRHTGDLYTQAREAGEQQKPEFLDNYFSYKSNVNDIRRSENLRNGFYISSSAFGFIGAVTFLF